MSTSPISPVSATPAPAPATGPRAAGAPERATPASSAAVTVDSIPASPPPEVLDAIGVASQAYDQLAASGRTVQFSLDGPGGQLTSQLVDAEGNVLGNLAPSGVLGVAAGEPIADNA